MSELNIGDAFELHPEEDNPEHVHIVFKLRDKSFEDKALLYLPHFRQMLADGFVMREVELPMRERVRVRNGETGAWHDDVLMMGSNNYLGFADHPAIKERVCEAVGRFGTGCGGPPLLNGTTPLHSELEQRLASLKGCEDAILFSSGYAANLGWTVGLLGKDDWLVYDSLSHASLFDSLRLGRFSAKRFKHSNLDSLDKVLTRIRDRAPKANVVVCVEGVYSMDGDLPPLVEIRELCNRHLALLAVDDAHGLGILGSRGRGAGEHFGLEGKLDLVVGTFSKTLAMTGGFVAGPAYIIEFLRSFARSYMFSAALSVPTVAGVLAGLDLLEQEPERVERLRTNTATFQQGMREQGYSVDSPTAIVPVLIPPTVCIREVVRELLEAGVFVNGVEFPAVPPERQRLRVSVMSTMTTDDLEQAATAFGKVGRSLGVLR